MSIFSFLIFYIYLLYYLHWCINTSELYHAVSSPEADCKIAQLLQGCMKGLIRKALKPRVHYIMPPTVEASSSMEAEGEVETVQKGQPWCGINILLHFPNIKPQHL